MAELDFRQIGKLNFVYKMDGINNRSVDFLSFKRA